MTQFRTRVMQKIDTTANWRQNPTFVPLKGEIIIYSDYQIEVVDGVAKSIPGIKIGDGTTPGIDLPFVDEDTRDQLLTHLQNNNIHISAQDRQFWNNKVRCYIELEEDEHGYIVESENLIFTTN